MDKDELRGILEREFNGYRRAALLRMCRQAGLRDFEKKSKSELAQLLTNLEMEHE